MTKPDKTQAVFKRLLLGPQRPVINLGIAVKKAGIPAGPMAVISAGWQEAEGDMGEVHEQLQRPLHDLGIYQKAEQLTAAYPEFAAAYRERQENLKDLQRLYRLRCKQLMTAARLALKAIASPAILEAEQHHAMGQVRELDEHHLRSMRAIHGQYDRTFDSLTGGEISAYTSSVSTRLDNCESLLITGGNVMVLLNRLNLFGLSDLLNNKHLVAWSAGAMVLSDTLVLFHDKTPLGRRDPEVVSSGCGVIPGFVFLPDAKRRLREGDTVRTRLMCRRFAPAQCVTLDNGAGLLFEADKSKPNHLKIADQVKVMKRDGTLEALRTE